MNGFFMNWDEKIMYFSSLLQTTITNWLHLISSCYCL